MPGDGYGTGASLRLWQDVTSQINDYARAPKNARWAQATSVITLATIDGSGQPRVYIFINRFKGGGQDNVLYDMFKTTDNVTIHDAYNFGAYSEKVTRNLAESKSGKESEFLAYATNRAPCSDNCVEDLSAAVNKDSEPGDRDFIPITRGTVGAEDGEAITTSLGADSASTTPHPIRSEAWSG